MLHSLLSPLLLALLITWCDAIPAGSSTLNVTTSNSQAQADNLTVPQFQPRVGFRVPVSHYTTIGQQDVDLEPRDNSDSRTSDISSPAAVFDGGGWVMSVTIGGQPVTLNVDTGSADLWTASALLPSDQQSSIATGQIYDPSKSQTYTNLTGYSFGVAYGDGSGATGPVGRDTVVISGATIVHFPFGLCSNLTYPGGKATGTRTTDGPIGLGFSSGNSINPRAQCTFMECLMPALPTPIFAANFKLNDTGFLEFGQIDKTAYKGQMTKVKVNNATNGHVGQWIVENVNIGMNGTTQLSNADVDINFDTGGPGLVLPSDIVRSYFSKLRTSTNKANNPYKAWTYNCDASLPSLDFIFGTAVSGPKTVSIPGSILADAYVNGTSNPRMCYTKIQETTPGGLGNAGIPFYITKYMVFNQAEPSLSFADQVNNIVLASSASTNVNGKSGLEKSKIVIAAPLHSP